MIFMTQIGFKRIDKSVLALTFKIWVIYFSISAYTDLRRQKPVTMELGYIHFIIVLANSFVLQDLKNYTSNLFQAFNNNANNFLCLASKL